MKRRKKLRVPSSELVSFEIVRNPNAPPMVIGYARVSTVEQSLSMQIAALKRAGVTDAGLYVEKVSAVSTRRPKLAEALDALRPGDTFAVWKMDRLARSLSDLLAKMDLITAKGAVFKSLTENIDLSTAGGKLMMQMLGVIAEFERNLTIERTTAGMARAREEGKQVGQPPALTPKQVEQAQKMRDKRKSVREIAAHFDVSHGTIYNWTDGPKRSRRKS